MDRIDAMRAFVRVVEGESFSSVAESLRVGQPTISKWIAGLERELGVQLIERTTRARRVTEAGHLFYMRAREILEGFEEVSAQLQARQPELRGRLRVSLPVVFGQRHVVPALDGFLRRHEVLELELVFNDRYVNLLEEGFDVAIRVGAPVDSTLRARTLATTPRLLVAAPAYLKAAPPLRRPADLADHACLLHTGLGVGASWGFTGAQTGEVESARVTARCVANHSEAILCLARQGHGVALLASWLVDEALRAGELVALLAGDLCEQGWRASPAPVQALMPPGAFTHPRVRALVDHLVEALSEDPLLNAQGAAPRQR